MKYVHKFYLFSLLTTISFPCLAEGEQALSSTPFTISPSLIYSAERFSWNIGTVGGVNILSELTWKNIKSLMAGVQLKKLTSKNFVFLADVRAGGFTKGQVQDSDYNGNDRTAEWSRSLADVTGTKFMSEFEVGYEFKPTPSLNITPSIGVFYNYTSFSDKNLRQVLSGVSVSGSVAPPVGTLISGKVSTYKAVWYGPLIRLDATFKPHNSWLLSAGLTLFWDSFKGTGNWLLRTDLARNGIRQAGSGIGTRVNLAASYLISQKWSIGLEVEGAYHNIKNGDDERYFADGSLAPRSGLLNDVTWKYGSIMLRATWKV